MNAIFYVTAFLAIFSTLMAISGRNAIHALLFLILSFLSISVIFYILGAPFIAALEVIIYAGAIMVLFIFVIMMLNVGIEKKVESKWLKPKLWILPTIIAVILFIDFLYMLNINDLGQTAGKIILPKQVGISLFTTYLIGVEIAGMILLAGIVGAYHIGKQKKKVKHRYLVKEEEVALPDEKTI
ncbi:MAG: NADH-quinone oxidoreductase subunit J [Omnitrophica WOR_2 bacterium]|jgi:NADH-quinone oxidoreductase subunit J